MHMTLMCTVVYFSSLSGANLTGQLILPKIYKSCLQHGPGWDAMLTDTILLLQPSCQHLHHTVINISLLLLLYLHQCGIQDTQL